MIEGAQPPVADGQAGFGSVHERGEAALIDASARNVRQVEILVEGASEKLAGLASHFHARLGRKGETVISQAKVHEQFLEPKVMEIKTCVRCVHDLTLIVAGGAVISSEGWKKGAIAWR